MQFVVREWQPCFNNLCPFILMDRLTAPERLQVVRTYYKNDDSVIGVLRGLQDRHNRSSEL